MIRLAANVSMMFPDKPPLDRLDAAAAAGFAAVEWQFPYGVDPAELAQRLQMSSEAGGDQWAARQHRSR
jgi:hydroxypyruvate isomerase